MPCAALSSSCAAIAAVLPSPLSARREPNQSSLPVFDALMNACCVHVVPLRTNTYAAPADVSSFTSLLHAIFGLTPVAMQSSSSEPVRIVLPSSLICVDTPIESPFSPLSALRYACCAQVVP